MRLEPFLILCIITASAFVLPLGLVGGRAADQAVSTIQALVPFSSTLPRTAVPNVGVVGPDLGTGTFAYSPTKLSWARSTGNFSLGSFTCAGTAMPTNGLKNSTVVQLQGSTFSLFVKNTSSPYVKEIIVTGSVGSLTTCTFGFSNPLGKQVSDCDTNASPLFCSTVSFGSEGFDWTGMPCNYNNQTLILSCNFIGSFTFDPIALDGSASAVAATGTSATCSLTTTSSPDVIMVGVNIFNEAGHAFSSITDTGSAGLSFTQRGSTIKQPGDASATNLRVYFAVASAALTTEGIKVTVASATYITLVCFGVSGANTAAGSIFDLNAGLPASTTANSNVVTTTFSTSNANDFIYNIAAHDQVAANGGCANENGCGSGFGTLGASTLIKKDGGVSESIAYNIVSATQSSKTAKDSVNAGTTHNLIGWVDAICQSGSACSNAVTQPVKISLQEAGAPTETLTISGCSPSPTTIADDSVAHNIAAQPSCSLTFTVKGDVTHSRYRFCGDTLSHICDSNAVGVTTWTFSTCASGTCSEKDNNTYFQLSQNYTATPQTPNTWDAAVTGNTITGTFLGASRTLVIGNGATDCITGDGAPSTFSTTQGGGVVTTNCVIADYNLGTTMPSKIGNTWVGQTPLSFTDTTANHIHNVNYIQTTSTADPQSFGWIMLVPFGLLIMVILITKVRPRVS